MAPREDRPFQESLPRSLPGLWPPPGPQPQPGPLPSQDVPSVPCGKEAVSAGGAGSSRPRPTLVPSISSDHAVARSQEHCMGVLGWTEAAGDPPWRQVWAGAWLTGACGRVAMRCTRGPAAGLGIPPCSHGDCLPPAEPGVTGPHCTLGPLRASLLGVPSSNGEAHQPGLGWAGEAGERLPSPREPGPGLLEGRGLMVCPPCAQHHHHHLPLPTALHLRARPCERLVREPGPVSALEREEEAGPLHGGRGGRGGQLAALGRARPRCPATMSPCRLQQGSVVCLLPTRSAF